VRLRLLCDKPETARRIWPGREFPDAAPVAAPADLAALTACRRGAVPELLDLGILPAPPFRGRALAVDSVATSQYDLLRDLGDEVGNIACLALSGGGFHGQHGRPWHALPGNLHLCLRAALDLPAAGFGYSLVMLPAVAVLEVLAAVGVGSDLVGVKWVNDILIGGRKVAGVLTAARTEGGRITSVVFGIGLNVACAPPGQGPVGVPAPTCLADHLPEPVPDLGFLFSLFLQVCADNLAALADRGPTPLFERYRGSSLVLGRQVEVWPETGEPGATAAPLHRGVVLDLLPDLALRLEGVAEPVRSGRITLADHPSR
jgi:biotin-[acetyl-CoA-carboxylase] ligase BirA-like protein